MGLGLQVCVYFDLFIGGDSIEDNFREVLGGKYAEVDFINDSFVFD